MTLILGIDPGSHVTGYGIIQHKGQNINYLVSGCIRTNANCLPLRLKLIYTGISDVIARFSPNSCVIEQIFVSKNVDSALKLAYTRGATIVAAINKDLPIFEYSARQVKKTVTGIGNAEKHQVQYMVRMLLKLQSNIQADAADALAIAITHCHMIKKL